jgi:hypothetical protein
VVVLVVGNWLIWVVVEESRAVYYQYAEQLFHGAGTELAVIGP